MNKKIYDPGTASRIAVSAMFVWASSVSQILAQAPAAQDAPPPGGGAAPANQVYSMTDLEYLMGPIALYPDPLIALILPASTFPLQIVQADRWLSANADAVKNNDFTAADAQGWDSSVQALVRFPEIIEMMADHLDWTQSLGSAFSQQPEDVANAVQLLRAQAQKAGNLASTPQQVVTTRQESGAPVIFIEPAEPDRIYVPVYDPGVIFTTAVTTGLVFGTAFFVGSYWNNRWGWNNRNWNTIWVNQPVWRPGRPGGPPPGAWRPDRPGGRPDRPGVRPPGGVRIVLVFVPIDRVVGQTVRAYVPSGQAIDPVADRIVLASHRIVPVDRVHGQSGRVIVPAHGPTVQWIAQVRDQSVRATVPVQGLTVPARVPMPGDRPGTTRSSGCTPGSAARTARQAAGST